MTDQQFSPCEAVNHSTEPAEEIWRNEVQDRLARYKRRRGRRIEGAFTMRFPFPADDLPEPVKQVEATTAVIDPVGHATEKLVAQLQIHQEEALVERTRVKTAEVRANPQDEESTEDAVNLILELPPPEPEPEPFVDSVVRPRPKRKVIAFPKHLAVAREPVYHLADPVTTEVPRILDVPEELQAIPTTPFLDGLQFESPTAAVEPRDHEHVELPCRPASISQRTFAAVVDVTVAGSGVAVFAAVAYKILDSPSLTKPLMVGIVTAAVVLWSAYQYLFVVHSGTTLGMLAARIKIRTFQGKPALFGQRRNRILGFYLSALSLGMGLMWAFVDVDELCWHDRLSRTYLCVRERS
ncbi:MAG TPA: RDD family protein [Terriglobales bacterium]